MERLESLPVRQVAHPDSAVGRDRARRSDRFPGLEREQHRRHDALGAVVSAGDQPELHPFDARLGGRGGGDAIPGGSHHGVDLAVHETNQGAPSATRG